MILGSRKLRLQDTWNVIAKQNVSYDIEILRSGYLFKNVTGGKFYRAVKRRLLNVPSGTSTMAVYLSLIVTQCKCQVCFNTGIYCDRFKKLW